jgi:fatty-acyl-CoA synthase
VAIPGTDGRAGMAAIVVDDGLDLAAFRTHLIDRLPDSAHPVFLRVTDDLDVTATFKHTKSALVREGYDPVAIVDAIYFNDPQRQSFVRLDKPLYDRIQTGQIRFWRRAEIGSRLGVRRDVNTATLGTSHEIH